jgi:hypothetical protein
VAQAATTAPKAVTTAPKAEPAAAAEAAPAPKTPSPPSAGAGAVAAVPDRLRRLAGWLAVAAAALAVVGLFLGFRYGTPLGGDRPEAVAPTLIFAALGAVAGACTLAPRTRRIVGPGLLLGAAPAWASGLVGLMADAALDDGFGVGFKVLFVADLGLILAACLAGFALARTGEARLGLPSERLPWLVALLGLAGAVLLAKLAARLLDLSSGWVAAPVVWTAVMALMVPAFVTLVGPRQLAVALLAGWVGGATAPTVYYFTVAVLELNKNGYDLGRVLIASFAVTLLALVAAAVLLARAAPASTVE